ncbi:ribokinase [Microbacterium terrisoli]|uniref:ribokinase n=1 Tax=Microbacterium terrisoli TaxID=3242192 RepID=UPI002804025E|nr:ribokinase [Microbacterium protaetiae]
MIAQSPTVLAAQGSTPRHALARVHVIGSINVDTILAMPTFPAPGTTVIATDSRQALGGKGAAQAIASARFGAQTGLTGSIGSDAEGDVARTTLNAQGVDDRLLRASSLPTGRAFVYVDRGAENEIVVDPGANADLKTLSAGDREAILAADVVLTQLEVGCAIAFEAIEFASQNSVTVILNAAPALDLPTDILAKIDFLIVNEPEATALSREGDAITAGERLARAVGTVLVTLGARGGRLHRRGAAPQSFPALTVTPADTTGAGDTVCGVFAAAIAQGWQPSEAFRVALVAGSIATTTRGNAPSIPDRSRILAMLPDSRGAAVGLP